MQLVIPGKERVAVDHLIDAQIHHELYPTVENGIVETPAPVFVLRPDNHVGIRIKALVVPGVLVQGSSNHFLSRIGQHLHQRFHFLEMGVAPQLQVVYTGYG
ncbi:hypothetical protein SDC9_147338 [bioreactor metagenome]|uniref:Uncharacterized protein n=1 Tax=bioreactor metagenome TaxID=1076179 RepID=A0A645EHA9_9ZZZZ